MFPPDALRASGEIAALASALATVLAWVAKLVWNKQYLAAEDEVIQAKEAKIEAHRAEIKSLKEMPPMKVRECLLSAITQLEEYVENLKRKLAQYKWDLSGTRGLSPVCNFNRIDR